MDRTASQPAKYYDSASQLQAVGGKSVYQQSCLDDCKEDYQKQPLQPTSKYNSIPPVPSKHSDTKDLQTLLREKDAIVNSVTQRVLHQEHAIERQEHEIERLEHEIERVRGILSKSEATVTDLSAHLQQKHEEVIKLKLTLRGSQAHIGQNNEIAASDFKSLASRSIASQPEDMVYMVRPPSRTPSATQSESPIDPRHAERNKKLEASLRQSLDPESSAPSYRKTANWPCAPASVNDQIKLNAFVVLPAEDPDLPLTFLIEGQPLWLAKVVQRKEEQCKLHFYQREEPNKPVFTPVYNSNGYPVVRPCQLKPEHVVSVLDELVKRLRGGGGQLPMRVIGHISRRIKGLPLGNEPEDESEEEEDGQGAPTCPEYNYIRVQQGTGGPNSGAPWQATHGGGGGAGVGVGVQTPRKMGQMMMPAASPRRGGGGQQPGAYAGGDGGLSGYGGNLSGAPSFYVKGGQMPLEARGVPRY